jgi:DNA-binding MarR family transcriptional regulator
MKKKSKITAEQIESSLSAFCQEINKGIVQPEKVPPGWFTVSDLAQELGKSPVTISERIRRLVKNGQAERKDFTIQLEQRARPVPHYRLLKK